MSPKRSNIYTPVHRGPTPISSSRIRIPQPSVKPITLFSKDAVKRELMGRQAAWFTLHHRGMKRPWIGVDPLEMRAVSRNQVRGTLPERIVFKALMLFGFVPGADFDFQSSQNGGRLELGGIISDFLFENLRFILQVEGPFHRFTLQSVRDKQQELILAEMGYDVGRLYEREIYNQVILEDKLRRMFGFARSSGRSYYIGETEPEETNNDWQMVINRIDLLMNQARGLSSSWLR